MPETPASLDVSAAVHLPPIDAHTEYCTLYHRDPGFSAVAEAELAALAGGRAVEPGAWLSPVPIRWASCGYGTAGGRQLAFGATLDDLAESLRALQLAAPHFWIDTRRLPRWLDGATAAKIRIADCIDGDVSREAPDLRLLLVMSALGFRLLVDSPARPSEAGWLDIAHKPHGYLVAAPVRLAMAMVNLTARPGESVLDPFCGTGTIALAAACVGHRAFASDVSAACVAHAAENFAHFELEGTLAVVDARDASTRADCIVSNLPYGLYSHFSPGALDAILRNLGRLAPRVTLVSSEPLDAPLAAAGFELLRVIPVESKRFERFVHVARSPV